MNVTQKEQIAVALAAPNQTEKASLMKLLISLLLCAAAWSQPALVTVGGTIYNSDGSGFSGVLTISNTTLLCSGAPIPAASRKYTVVSGVVTPAIQLFPLADCSPAYSYTAVYQGNMRSTVFWNVHGSPPVTTIGDVQGQGPLPASMQVNPRQVAGGTTAGQVLTWNGSSVVWAQATGGHYETTINGNSLSILASVHGRGAYPLMSVYAGGAQVPVVYAVNPAGDISASGLVSGAYRVVVSGNAGAYDADFPAATDISTTAATHGHGAYPTVIVFRSGVLVPVQPAIDVAGNVALAGLIQGDYHIKIF